MKEFCTQLPPGGFKYLHRKANTSVIVKIWCTHLFNDKIHKYVDLFDALLSTIIEYDHDVK